MGPVLAKAGGVSFEQAKVGGDSAPPLSTSPDSSDDVVRHCETKRTNVVDDRLDRRFRWGRLRYSAKTESNQNDATGKLYSSLPALLCCRQYRYDTLTR